ncbi:hypothetical protein LBMAG27_11060 [Bacteroidota bacterium]|nr:hypothetical protein LBMAG27_11060 [Bacteroidota bacterium]
MSKKQPAETVKKKNTRQINLDEPWYVRYAIPTLALLIFAVYTRSISLGYTYLDDTVFMFDKGPENEHFSNIFKAFFEGTFGVKDVYYRPLFRITFIVERQFLFLFPKEDFAVDAMRLAHFIEIILHIISVSLLFKLLQKFSFSKSSAFMWSAVYAVHPVLTMAVAWIPGRNDLMLSIFLISFFLNFFNYLETQKRKHLIWQFIFLMLALLTKESGVFIPFAAVFYLLLFNKKNLLSKNMLLIYSVWMVELIGWFFLRNNIIDPKQMNQSFNETISTAIERVPGLIQYLGKIFLPVNLTVYPTIADTSYLFGLIAIIVLIILIALNKNRNWKMILFGLGWFVLFIFPFFFVPKKINDALYEHRLYIPMFGMILISREALPLIEKFISDFYKYIIVTLVILFSISTINYMQYFNDEISYYTKAVKDSPSSAYATKMLGVRLVYKSREEEAIPYFKKSFEMDTTQMYTRYFLAKLIYEKQGNYTEAKRLLKDEIKLSPTFTENYFDLAFIAYKENDFTALIYNLKKVIELLPDDKMSNNNLLKAYLDTKNKKEATRQIDYMRSKGIFIDQGTLNAVYQLPD